MFKKDAARDVLHGVAIGIANIIPGVSGGTIAVVLGIYDRVIESINQVISQKENRRQNLVYIGKLGIGAVLGVAVFAALIKWLLDVYPAPTQMFFLGLIIGSIPIVMKNSSDMRLSPTKGAAFCAAAAAMLAISMVPEDANGVTHQLTIGRYVYLGVSGFVGVGTMVVPGVSGSLMLVLMGTYFDILNAITTFNVGVLASVGVGVVVGGIVFTKVIAACLRSQPGLTHYVILGLIVGSLYGLWPGVSWGVSGGVEIAIGVAGLLVARRIG